MKRFLRCISLSLVLVLILQMLPETRLNVHAEEASDLRTSTSDEIQNNTGADTKLSDVHIVGEVESLREEDTKHFRMSDGSFTAVSYNSPVHYQDTEGVWREICNTPIMTTDTAGKDTYQITNAFNTTAFSASLQDGHIMTVSNGQESISMSLLDPMQAVTMAGETRSVTTGITTEPDFTYNRNAIARLEAQDAATIASTAVSEVKDDDFVPDNLSSSIIYENVFPDVDIRYTNWSYHTKEEIIVKDLQNSYSYDFLLTLKGLTPRMNEDGSLSLLNLEDEEIYLIPVPYMTDASGATSGLVSYEMTAVRDGFILTVKADKEWIEGEERTLPVLIDPTITTSKLAPFRSADDDIYSTYVNPVYQTSCYYYRGELLTGYLSGYTDPYITYLYFNNLPTIPVGSMISDAVVRLYMGSYTGSGSLPIGAYQVTSGVPSTDVHAWFKTLTYSNKPGYDSQKLIDFMEISSTTSRSYYTWDMTQLVKSWYNGASDRMVAFLPIAGTSVSGNALQFYPNASDHLCPVLMVTYRNSYGLEDYYTYQTMDVGHAGNAYVADSTGQLKVVKNLLSSNSQALPFSLNLVYNSDYFMNSTADYLPPTEMGLNMSVGSGWTLDCVQTVTGETFDSTYYLKHRDGDGTIHYYKRLNTESNIYSDEDGLNLSMTPTGTNTIRLENHLNSYRIFRNGFLSEMVDWDQNKILIHYTDNRITSITRQNNGGAEEILASFTYGGNNLLTRITDAAENEYTLGYTAGKLTSVQKNGTTTAAYQYSGNRISRMTDSESGYSMQFTYGSGTYDQGKVTGFNEKVGSSVGASVTVTYPGEGQTVYRDHGPDRVANNGDDLLSNYLYDYAGRTFNIYVTDNTSQIYGASNGVYTENSYTGKTNNRILRSATIGMVAQQLIENGSFETGTWTHSGTSVTTAKPRTGQKSLTGTTTRAADIQTAQMSVQTLTAGKTYTFSGYVRTDGMDFSGKGIYLKVSDGSGRSWIGVPVAYTTDENFDHGWTRISVTFTVQTAGAHTLSICREGATGTFYADDFQLEQGEGPSAHNMLENGAMTGSGYWTCTGGGVNNSGHMRITGNATASHCAYQDIPVNLPGTETYVLSGWVKATATPDTVTKASDSAEDTYKQCGLRAMLTYSDGTKEYHYVPFNTDVNIWQFVSYAVIPKQPTKTVTSIRVFCAFERNVGTAEFDNIALIRQTAQSMTYDENGHLVSVAAPGMDTDVNTYSGSQLLITKQTQGYGTYNYSYNGANHYRPSSVTNSGLTESWSYNTRGNLLSTTISASGSKSIVTSSSYSGDGNLLASVTDAAGNTVTYTYGDANSVMQGLPTALTAPNGTVTANVYDLFNRVTQTSVANASTILYNYSNGSLSSIVRTGSGNTQTYSLVNDAFGNTTSIQVGSRVLAGYEYGAKNGWLTKQTDGNADTVSYTYDLLGRVKTATWSDGRVVSYGYSGEGSLYSVTVTEDGKTTTYLYTYDSQGRLTTSQQVEGGAATMTTRQGYDGSNRLAYQGWQFGSTAYSEKFTYDSSKGGSLKTHITATGQTLTMGYDALRRLSSVTGGIYGKSYTYRDIDSSKTTAQVASLSYDLPTDQSFSYTYDNMGNIATYTDSGGTVTYTYDAQGQLLSASNGYSYTYDTVGNILTGNGHTYTYGDPDWKDLLTAVDGQTITYDAVGNPTSYYNGTRWTFTWEQGRRLSTATDGNTNLSFTYDADGLRTGKTVGDVKHTYYYVGGKLLRETYGNNTLDFFYDSNGHPYALKHNGAVYYYITNLQGDVMSIVDGSGAVKATYNYDPYGNVITASGDLAEVNPLRYRGYYYDTETTLYYLQSRYYDPEIGRFLNADAFASTGQGILGNNMFAYCLNNPTSNIDNHGNLCRPSMIALNDCGNPPVTTPHVAGSPSTQTWGTVSGQDLLPYSSNTCGLGTYAHNGCALIAVYNAMQLIGKPHSLQAVTDAFFWDYGMVAFGLLGVGPWSMDNYFDANGVNYIGSSNASSLTSDISEGSVIIYTVMFSGGWHAMTACYTNGVYIVFNQYDNDPTPNDYDSLADSYSNGVWIYGYRIDP